MGNLRMFWSGATVGALLVYTLIAASARADDGPIGEPAPLAGLPARAEAQIEGGDWGTIRVTARSGQRINATLSLSEPTRVSFEGDGVANVRAAQNGRAGAPMVEFEADETTGDLYLVVTQGAVNQIVSTFITTRRGDTYHVMWTIRDQPASQVFVRGERDEEVLAPTGGRASGHQDAIVQFARFAFEAAPGNASNRADEVAPGIFVRSLGSVEEGGLFAHIFELRNETENSIPVDHSVFATGTTVAIASAFDDVAPQSMIRVIVIEPREADHE